MKSQQRPDGSGCQRQGWQTGEQPLGYCTFSSSLSVTGPGMTLTRCLVGSSFGRPGPRWVAWTYHSAQMNTWMAGTWHGPGRGPDWGPGWGPGCVLTQAAGGSARP